MPPVVMFILVVLAPVLQSLPAGQKYEVVIPRQIDAVYKTTTQDKYPHFVKYEFHIEEKPLVLHLERNMDLIADDYTETSYSEDNSPITITPKKNMKDHCHYQGFVENDNKSQVSISACTGISGVMVTQGKRLIIEPLNLAEGLHAVYNDEEEVKPQSAYGVTTEVLGGSLLSPNLLPNLNGIEEEIEQLLNSKKYIEMVVIADNSMLQKYGNDAAVKDRIFTMVNYINMDFKVLNVYVTLKAIEVWDTKDQINVSLSILDTLNDFCNWKKDKLLPRIDHDNAQLLTNIDFSGVQIGLGNVGAMCDDKFSAAVVQNHMDSAASVASTWVHEVGHNLGMVHDNSSCSCPLPSCIMSPHYSSPPTTRFSNCSLDHIRKFIISRVPMCLLNKPTKENIVSPPLCGNNIIEEGEECDCGLVQECTNPCCNASTCKMKPGLECTEGECCENCKFKKAGSICKESLHDCDLPDTCDGKSSRCLNLFKEDGISCMNNKGYCLQGKCPTMENQCHLLWGSDSTVSPDKCFLHNTLGKFFGYCTQVEEKYQRCLAKDMKCGVLYCQGGRSSAIIPANTMVTKDQCKAVLHPKGKVENGIKCADEQVCYNGECIRKEHAHELLTGVTACHVNCNKKGQCYCDEASSQNAFNKPDNY